MSTTSSSSAWRIAPAFAAFYGLLGVLQPFLPPTLRQQGLSSEQTGLVLGAAALLTSISPLLVSRYLASRLAPAALGRVFATCVALFSVVILALSHASLSIWVASVVLFAAMWSPLAALLDTLAVAATQTGRWQYGQLRMMGSFGFIAVSSIMGLWTSDHMSGLLHTGLIIVGLCVGASGWLLPDVAPKAVAKTSSGEGSVQIPHHIKLLLAGMVVHWASFGAYQYGYTMLARESGLSSQIIGVAWSLGVISEVICFYIASALIRRLGWWPVMLIAFVCAGTRWAVLGLYPAAQIVLISQLLHGPGFAFFYAAAMNAIDRAGPPSLTVTLQGLFTGLVTGFGAFIGNVWAGWANSMMPIHSVFIYSLPLQAVALLLLFRAREPRASAQTL